MNCNQNNEHEDSGTLEINLMQLVKALWKKAWLIVLACIVTGTMALGYTKIFVKPQYSSSVMLYVNNKSNNSANDNSINASFLAVVQKLVETYIVILRNRTTMNQIAEKTELEISGSELLDMISASVISDTEVFRVTVTTDDPYKAALIADCVADVLPARVFEIIDGSSMRVVDRPIVNTDPVSPSIMKNTIIGIFIGFVLACGIIFVLMLLDDVIHNEDYIVQTYNLPILAKVPDLMRTGDSGKYGYRSHYEKHVYEK